MQPFQERHLLALKPAILMTSKVPFTPMKKLTEVYFIAAGELVPRVNGRRYGVRGSQPLYIPPGLEHRTENSGSKACRLMTICPSRGGYDRAGGETDLEERDRRGEEDGIPARGPNDFAV